MKWIRFKNIAFLFVLLIQVTASAQQKPKKERLPDSLFIRRYDTLLHLQSSISANQMQYRFFYTKDFKLILAPNDINNFSLGFSYRFLDLGLTFTPQIMNANQDRYKKGQSDRFSLGFGFSMHQFRLAFDLTTVKGFYLRNTSEFQI